jgi:hypothetical protein
VLRVVRAEGPAAERGRTIGRELGETVARSLAFYRELVSPRDAASLVAPYRAAADALPEYVDLLEGRAAGAEVPAEELWLVNAFEEVEPGLERCSTFTVLADGATLLAHNEQWLAGDAGNLAVVVEACEDGTRLASPTVCCCLPAVGMNSHGLAQGIDSLSARDDRIGIPRVLVSRYALAARDLDDAAARARIARRAGGYAHVLARSGGEARTVETSATRSATLGPGPHTNHYLDPELARDGDASEGSVARHERLAELLRERPPATPVEAMELLRDHASTPQAICEHGAPEDAEASVVLFSMVCELEAGRMWVAPGNPCETAYEEVDLAGLE